MREIERERERKRERERAREIVKAKSNGQNVDTRDERARASDISHAE
jgi:hypothetical protein